MGKRRRASNAVARVSDGFSLGFTAVFAGSGIREAVTGSREGARVADFAIAEFANKEFPAEVELGAPGGVGLLKVAAAYAGYFGRDLGTESGRENRGSGDKDKFTQPTAPAIANSSPSVTHFKRGATRDQ